MKLLTYRVISSLSLYADEYIFGIKLGLGTDNGPRFTADTQRVVAGVG